MTNDLKFDGLDDDDDTLPEPLLRVVSNLLVGWAQCHSRACRGAHCCKGDPDACLSRCVDRVSDEVWAGAWAVVQGHMARLSFDKAFAKWPAEFRALNDWRQRHDPKRLTVFAGGTPYAKNLAAAGPAPAKDGTIH